MIVNKYKFSTSIRLQTVFKHDVEQDLHSYSKQPSAHSFFQSNFLVGKIMFPLSLLCKKNASQIQNYPYKYSLNWKSFRHKEMEFLPFLVVTTNVWYSILNLLRYFIQRNFSVRRVMNHIHSVTFFYTSYLSIINSEKLTCFESVSSRFPLKP